MSSSTTRSTKHLDPKAPLVIDTHELGRSPGSMREIRRTVHAPRPIGIDVISIAEGSPIDLDIRLEAVVEGVLISVRALAEATGECVRCLDPVKMPLDLRFQELYRYEPDPPGRGGRNPAGKMRAEEEGEDEIPSLVGELADIEPALVDAAVLELPFQPHCRPDCPGLCQECGARLAENPGHRHESADARWSGLAGLVFEDSAPVGDTERLGDGGPSRH